MTTRDILAEIIDRAQIGRRPVTNVPTTRDYVDAILADKRLLVMVASEADADTVIMAERYGTEAVLSLCANNEIHVALEDQDGHPKQFSWFPNILDLLEAVVSLHSSWLAANAIEEKP